MKKIYLIPAFILLTSTCFAKNKKEKIAKENKISYNDYMTKYGENDTISALINIYYDKRENAGVGQMSFLPLTGTLAIVVPPIGIGLSVISAPLFVKGLITYNKYSNKKLNKALASYAATKTLSKSMKKRIVKEIKAVRLTKEDEMIDLRFASLKEIRDI